MKTIIQSEKILDKADISNTIRISKSSSGHKECNKEFKEGISI